MKIGLGRGAGAEDAEDKASRNVLCFGSPGTPLREGSWIGIPGIYLGGSGWRSLVRLLGCDPQAGRKELPEEGPKRGLGGKRRSL